MKEEILARFTIPKGLKGIARHKVLDYKSS